MNDKAKVLYLDMNGTEYCNLSCGYCREDVLILKKAALQQHFFKVKQGLSDALTRIDPIIIKTSGYGEITLYNDFMELFDISNEAYWQIITNGTLLNQEKLEYLSQHKNISLCYSLDGHRTELNRIRTTSDSLLEKVLNNIDSSVKLGIPVEINSVLTVANITEYNNFLDYLSQYSDEDLMIFPFVVRPFPGLDNEHLFPSEKNIKQFEETINQTFEKFSKILPPKAYLKELIKFMKRKRRSTPCHLPALNVGIDPQGEILICPCGPDETVGNINSELVPDLSKFPFKDRGEWKECADCYNHYEVLSLYLTGKVSIDEIKRIPSLNNTRAVEFLQKTKQKLRK